jgi:flagellar L-ring protein precursor FlgH
MKTKCRFISKSLLAFLSFTTSLHAGSLWRDGITDERGMFADKRAKRVGDIVTVIVQESVSVSNTVRTKTDKTAKSAVVGVATDMFNQFLYNLPGKVFSKDIKKVLPANAEVPNVPGLAAAGTNDYTGGGEIKNSQTIASRCAVQVIDTLPNGNLVIEGLREVSFSKERQFASVRGIVRPYDIQSDNTVLSSNVADARIEIVSEGTLTEAQKKGWLLRLNDKINPF